MEQEILNASNDSLRAVALDNISWEYIQVNPSKGIPYIEEAIQICSKGKYLKLRSTCYNTFANLLEASGELDKAESFFLKSIVDKKALNDLKGIATVYSNLAKIYRQQGRFKEGINALNTSLHIHDSLKNDYGMFLAHTNLGNIYKSLGRYEESIRQHKKVLRLTQKMKDTLAMAYAYVNIGSIYIDEGKYESGTQNLLQGLKILEKRRDFPAQILVLSNLGSAYLKVNNFKIASIYIDKALKLSNKHKIYIHLPSVYQTIGEINLGLKLYAKAQKAFQKGYKHAVTNEDVFLQIELLGNLGTSLEKLNQTEKSIVKYNQAIGLARKYKVKATEFKCLCKASDLLIKQAKPEKSKVLLQRAWILAKESNIKKIYLLYYTSAIQLARTESNPAEVIKIYDQYFLYRDSIMPENIQTSMSEANVKFETEKKANQIQLLKQNQKIRSLELKTEKLKTEKRNYLIVAGLLLFIVVSVYTYFVFRKERKLSIEKRKLAIKQTEEYERKRIARDIHDDLGSGLSRIRFLTEGLEIGQTDENFLKKLNAVNSTAFGLVENMRELIWALNPENNTLENIFIRINEYTADYLEDFPIESRVILPTNVPALIISNEISRNLFSIIKEIIQNVVKHAEAKNFEIQIICGASGFILKTKDDGKGFEAGNNFDGNGLKNIRNRMEIIQGDICFRNEGGSEITIQIEYNSLLVQNTTFM